MNTQVENERKKARKVERKKKDSYRERKRKKDRNQEQIVGRGKMNTGERKEEERKKEQEQNGESECLKDLRGEKKGLIINLGSLKFLALYLHSPLTIALSSPLFQSEKREEKLS